MASQRQPKLSRREARDLDIEIGFLEGLTQRDPSYVEALQLLGDHYTLRGRPKDSLTVDQRLLSLRPEDPHVRFNLACSLALSGELERACDELLHALDLGFRDFRALQRDADLVEVRKHPSYKKIREKVKLLKETS